MIDIEKLYIFNVNYLMRLETSKTLGNHRVSVSVCSVTTLCYPMDCSPAGSSVHGDSPGHRTGVDCHAFLQGIFPTQGSNPGLPHFGQILHHLSHQGSCNHSEIIPNNLIINLGVLLGAYIPDNLNITILAIWFYFFLEIT